MQTNDHTRNEVVFGWGVFPEACCHVRSLGCRPLVLTGQTASRRSGVLERLLATLVNAGLEPAVVDGIGPEPTVAAVDRAADEARRRGSDVVVALGGGSVIDAAKAVAACVPTGAGCWQLTVWGRSDTAPAAEITDPLPVVAIPTVTGTGAEANGTGVVVHQEAGQKAVFLDDRLRPALAVVDPSLAVSVGPLRTWTGAIDTVTHGIEDFLTQPSPDAADRDRRLRLTRLALDMGSRAALQPDDREARSVLARLAMEVWDGTYSSAETPWTLHAIAHVVGARLAIGHGLTLTLLLPSWLELIRKHDPDRFAGFSPVAPAFIELPEWPEPTRARLEQLPDEILSTYGGADGTLPGWPHLTRDDVYEVLARASARRAAP